MGLNTTWSKQELEDKAYENNVSKHSSRHSGTRPLVAAMGAMAVSPQQSVLVNLKRVENPFSGTVLPEDSF